MWQQNILGEVDDDINFTYEENTEVYRSCAASLNDEMWVFGGFFIERQVNLKWTDNRAGIDSVTGWKSKKINNFALD